MRAPCVPRIIFSNFCMFVAMQLNIDDEKAKEEEKNMKNDEVCNEPTNLQRIHNVTVATCQNDRNGCWHKGVGSPNNCRQTSPKECLEKGVYASHKQ